jgi:hypothetical protein
MKASAMLKVWSKVSATWDESHDFSIIRVDALQRMFDLARWPSASTSQPSNLMHTFTLAAWADVLDNIGRQ